MDRRTFIAAGSVLLAGCSNSSNTDTASSTPTSTASPTSTSSPTATESPTPTQTPTETASPTQSPTPEPSEVELALEAAVEDLDAALEAWSAPNYTLLETNARTGQFSQRSVRDELDKAKKHLGEAKNEMGDETPQELNDRHKRLLGVYWFFYWGGPVQAGLKETLRDLTSVEKEVYSTDSFQRNVEIDKVEEHFKTVDENLEKLRRDSSPTDAQAPTALTEELYRSKLAQFEDERSQMESMLDLFRDFSRTMRETVSGLESYNNGNYTDASAAFYNASTAFSNFEDNLNPEDYEPSLRGIIDRLICVSSAMAPGCSDLDTAATAGSNGNDSKRDSAKENAKADFEECDVVFDHVHPLADFYGVETTNSLIDVVFEAFGK